MKICYQPTLAVPSDWHEVDSQDWSKTAKKLQPSGTRSEIIDDSQGWIHRVCIQGVEFVGDHHACEHLSDTKIKYTVWNDDPRDYPPGERFASVWTFETLAADSYLGGAINTRQSRVVYADQGGRLWKVMHANGIPENTTYLDWSLFPKPNEALTRHGIWVSDDLNRAHEKKYTKRSWREWNEGVDSSQIIQGRVRAQRPQGKYLIPDGTRTFFQTSTALTNGIHDAVDTADEFLLDTTAAASSGSSGTFSGGASGYAFIFTTASGEPNDAAWPSGNYRCQLDVPTVGADLTYGFLTQGSASGHFARVNSGLTSDLETWTQGESAFSGTGLKLATTGSITPSSGNASDRWELALAAQRPASHGNQTLDLTFDADAFADGPWTAAAPPEANAVFFGANF